MKNQRIWTFTLLSALLAAGAAQAAPPTPEARRLLSETGSLGIFEPEPFSATPPRALQADIAARLARAAGIQLHMVVILADFSDNRANRAVLTPAHFDSAFFSRGVYPSGSMADYYYENSNGKVTLTGLVTGWYMMPELYQTYVSGQAGRGLYPTNVQGFVEDALAAADPYVNFAFFDNNGPDGVADTIDDDEIVDLVVVIHAGQGGESAGSRTSLQSLAWLLPADLPLDGVNVREFAVVPELGALGVYAHETGHLLGLPDLYDVTGGSFGLGTWSLMAGGWSLDQARTPAHLDAWCKARLGFINPSNVFGVIEDQVIDPVETGGKVYHLGRNGLPGGTEYFLVENRQRIGFDRFLPGSGLLIYHVDELSPTNNIPASYKVAVEQADGLFQLENFYQNPSFGDSADLYTGATPSGGFGRFTVPDSKNHDGDETGAAVYRISGPDAQLKMTATLRAVPGAVARLTGVEFAPAEGDEDGFIGPGESFQILPAITVQDGPVHDVRLEISSDDPLFTTPGSVSWGDVGSGSHIFSVPAGVASGLALDPYALRLNLRMTFLDEVPVRRQASAPVGTVLGMEADFESDWGGFTHHFLRAGYSDVWRQEVSGGNGGPRAWHCGRAGGGFASRTDAQLETPFFLIPPDGHLSFDQLVQIPRDDSGQVVAGAFVEISVNGGPWTQVAPTRGYDYRFFSANVEYNNRMIFTGGPVPPDVPSWETLSFDLSAWQGGAVARFRLFSTAEIQTGIGWWIDNVRVTSGPTPVRLAALSASPVEGGVRIAWTLADPEDAAGLFLTRAPAGSETFVRIGGALLPAERQGEFLDRAPLGAGARYGLHAVARDGAVLLLGRVSVGPDAVAAPPRLAAYPNPARGSVHFDFNTSAAAPVRLTVFDAAGRAVRIVFDGRLEKGDHDLAWDGTDATGAPIAAGVYFYRLERGGAVTSRKLVMAR